MYIRRSRLTALSLGIIALTSGCGQASGSTEEAAHADGHGHGGPSLLNAADSREVGAIVTDVNGFTLYRYEKDSATPPVSNCDATCTEKWRPLIPDRHMHAHGVAQELVGKMRRPDGTWQATLAGWPLYRFTGDARPGEVSGQGRGDSWFAVTPSGSKAEKAQVGY
jgi:predicted lipoprotein with Yx(FWY)xxD motif